MISRFVCALIYVWTKLLNSVIFTAGRLLAAVEVLVSAYGVNDWSSTSHLSAPNTEKTEQLKEKERGGGGSQWKVLDQWLTTQTGFSLPSSYFIWYSIRKQRSSFETKIQLWKTSENEVWTFFCTCVRPCFDPGRGSGPAWGGKGGKIQESN